MKRRRDDPAVCRSPRRPRDITAPRCAGGMVYPHRRDRHGLRESRVGGQVGALRLRKRSAREVRLVAFTCRARPSRGEGMDVAYTSGLKTRVDGKGSREGERKAIWAP